MSKIEALRADISSTEGAIVAYSGGCDSALVADLAHELLGERALAVTAVSPSLAPAERDAARALAHARGWRHREIETAEMERAEYRRNAPDRCYHCKTELFEVLASLAGREGAPVLVGTNLDDLGDFRPGQRAAAERGVRTPLADAGLTKQEVRAIARDRGLAVWDKPASACLASRIAYGIEVTAQRLDRVGRAEAMLRDLGFREIRVRDHGDLARIEVGAAEVERLARPAIREGIAAFLREQGFDHVTLDLEGLRSGSMNAGLLRIRSRAREET